MADKKRVTKKPKAIIDVAKPGTSAPSTSGKPVIVTNRPMLKDPMVVDKQPTHSKPAESATTAEPENTDPELLTAVEAKKVDAPKETIADTPESKTQPTDEVDLSKKEEKADAQKPGQPDTKTAAQADSAEGADETAGEEATAVKSDAQQEAEAAAIAEHDAATQKLIDDKQYFLPINAIEKRKSKRFVALGIVLSVLLALAWVDIALDAGLVHINGVKPVTHFFSN
jgi:hypothetical protein